MYRRLSAFALAIAGLAAILAPSPLTAQVIFRRTYGGTGNDYGYSVRQTADGGYIIVGHTLSFGADSADIYLVKTAADGATSWTKTFGGTGNDYGLAVRQTSNGGYIIAGITFSFGRPDGEVYLIRTNAAGELQWSRTFGGSNSDHGCDVEQTVDGGFIVAGKYGRATGYDDVFLVKTDSLGDTRWTRTYGGDSSECGWAVQQTEDGGYVVAGNTNSLGNGESDAYLLRVDADGDTLWTRTFGGAGFEGAYSVQPIAGGGYILAGETESFGAGSRDVYLIKTDTNGNALWSKTFGGTDRDDGSSVQPTADGGYIIVGSTESYGAGDVDVYLIKTNASGDTLWTRTCGGRDWEIGKSVRQAADGGYIIAGHTESFGAGLIDVYLIKTDSLGISTAVEETKTTPTRAGALSLSCEPNPFAGRTTVRLSPGAIRHSPLTLRVYDAQGRLVHSAFEIRASSFPLDMRSMPAGAYFIRCDAAGEHATTRIILQR